MRIPMLKATCLLALAAAVANPLAATSKGVDEVMSRDGLQQIHLRNIDLAYARPGASLATYKRVMLDPVEVEFSKQWKPERTGSRLKLTTQEREDIRAAVARAVQDEFAREMQRNGSHPIASEAGPDVLRIKPRIVNLYLNAPDAGNTARTRTFVSNAGEMTLVAEIFDSASGQLLARLADRREATPAFIRYQLANNMVNENEARTIAAAWAQILREALDKAHGIGS
ncbi:MAG: hypothetical protein JWQ76_3731 [Ramlibacter sp.]|nr:hypothetical protein [Ramlibacter sp.]